jgi:hypothetical protein
MRKIFLVSLIIFQAILSMGDLPILEKNIDFNKRMKRVPAEESKNKQKKLEESQNERNNNSKDKRKSSDHQKTF